MMVPTSPILSESLRITDQTGLWSALTSWKAFLREPTSLAMRFTSSSKTSQRRFVKMSGRMESLYFATSLAPRMEQAASQIQDSRDLDLMGQMAWEGRRNGR